MANALARRPQTTFVPVQPTRPIARSRLRSYAPGQITTLDEFRRDTPGVGMTGVHALAVALVPGLYGLMLVVMWATFGADLETGLLLAVITVFALIYFGLLGGGLLLADAAPVGSPVRSFAAFLRGPVEIAGGQTTGRDALVQIAGLPIIIVLAAIALGIIARSA